MTPILLDTIVLIIMMLSIVVAFFRGFIKEILTIVNLTVAAGAAYLLAPMLLPTAKGWFGVAEAGGKAKDILGVIPPTVMATFVAYAIVYFSAFIILSLAGMAISSSVKAMGLGPLDRGLGMVFGAVRGFLLVFVVYLPFAFFMQPEQLPTWAKDSISVSVLHSAYQKLDAYVKGEDVSLTGNDGEGAIDPNSLRGKLKKMSDGVIEHAEGAHENVTDQMNSGDTRDILTDDEKGTQ